MSSVGFPNANFILGIALDRHIAMCRGKLCAACLCDLPDAEAFTGVMRLCATCWPAIAIPWKRLHASIQWSADEGWTMCLCYPTPEDNNPPVAFWLLLHDRRECLAILNRYLCSQSDLEYFQRLPENSGHATIAFFVGPRRLAALAQATRRDSRSAYQKRKAISSGRSAAGL